MANPGYVRSTDGSDGDNGSTWALANATLAGAITDASAGDRIWVSQVHAESTAGVTTWTFPGTLASPNLVLCGNDAAEPPPALATGGTAATSGANSLTINGTFYWYGLGVICSNAANAANLAIANGDNNHQFYEGNKFTLGGSTTTNRIILGSASANTESSILFKNCSFKFASTSHGFQLRQASVRFSGGSIDGTGSAITLFVATANAESVDMLVEGMDLSAMGSAMNLVVTGGNAPGKIIFRNCRLPASWSGALLSGSPTNMAFRVEMYNSANSGTNYALWVEDYAGSTRHETTIVRSSGASDGVTSLSWKMVSTANAEYPAVLLNSPEIVLWNDATGSAITVTVEVVTDNVTLNDDECWLEVQYLGSSSYPLGSFINDSKSDILASAAAQTSSSVTWTTTGLTTPLKQKLSVTFTPQSKGFIHAVVKLAKASTTVYVDPLLVVT